MAKITDLPQGAMNFVLGGLPRRERVRFKLVNKKMKEQVECFYELPVNERAELTGSAKFRDLPPETLEKIIRNLSTPDLLIFQLANRTIAAAVKPVMEERLDEIAVLKRFSERLKNASVMNIERIMSEDDFPVAATPFVFRNQNPFVILKASEHSRFPQELQPRLLEASFVQKVMETGSATDIKTLMNKSGFPAQLTGHVFQNPNLSSKLEAVVHPNCSIEARQMAVEPSFVEKVMKKGSAADIRKLMDIPGFPVESIGCVFQNTSRPSQCEAVRHRLFSKQQQTDLLALLGPGRRLRHFSKNFKEALADNPALCSDIQGQFLSKERDLIEHRLKNNLPVCEEVQIAIARGRSESLKKKLKQSSVLCNAAMKIFQRAEAIEQADPEIGGLIESFSMNTFG